MKRTPLTLTLILITLVSLMAIPVQGGEDNSPAGPQNFNNQTNCPVMGGKIDSTQFTDIQGQRIYHCCSGCSAKLKADPETYFKKAAGEAVLFENIQTKCPVNGKDINNSFFTYYQGRGIYFASEKCQNKFAKDPSKYLAKLNDSSQDHDMKRHDESHDTHQSGGHDHHGGGCGGF